MLSRIGNSLFWTGRYIERAEHIARFTRVQYLSSLDAPLAQKKHYILESILDMVGYQFNKLIDENKLSEEEVLFFVCLDPNNPNSVIASINYARENVRGARDTVSSEFWEILNKYYHEINGYSHEEFLSEGPFDFSEMIYRNSSIVKGCIDNTHIHNDPWAILSMGLHLERAVQITRILIAKLNDIRKIEKGTKAQAIINYQIGALLKSTESFDMSRKYFKTIPSLINALDFLMLNVEFPKSLSFNLTHASIYLNKINLGNPLDRTTPEFRLEKIANKFKYLSVEEIEKNALGLLEETLNELYGIGAMIEKKYLSF
ncbi:MAG: alpha-E domain-containing protein [Bacteroidota bacterium]|nr:alpha-E domain-containing protein [Bacteroidota bacterium]